MFKFELVDLRQLPRKRVGGCPAPDAVAFFGGWRGSSPCACVALPGQCLTCRADGPDAGAPQERLGGAASPTRPRVRRRGGSTLGRWHRALPSFGNASALADAPLWREYLLRVFMALSKTRPVWPASIDAAQAADWPRPAEAWGSLR